MRGTMVREIRARTTRKQLRVHSRTIVVSLSLSLVGSSRKRGGRGHATRGNDEITLVCRWEVVKGRWRKTAAINRGESIRRNITSPS